MIFNPILIIEIVVIILIITYQIKVAISLNRNIRKFSRLIPDKNFFKIEEVFVDKKILKNGNFDEIIEYINLHSQDEGNYKNLTKNDIKISLINPNNKSDTYFDNIIESLNMYLFKNNGAIADFNIVKDLVERNISVEEDQIREITNIPLYLGLMATLI